MTRGDASRRLFKRRAPVYAGRGGIRREVRSILFGGARRRRGTPLWAALVLAAGGAAALAAERTTGPEPPAPSPTRLTAPADRANDPAPAGVRVAP